MYTILIAINSQPHKFHLTYIHSNIYTTRSCVLMVCANSIQVRSGHSLLLTRIIRCVRFYARSCWERWKLRSIGGGACVVI